MYFYIFILPVCTTIFMQIQNSLNLVYSNVFGYIILIPKILGQNAADVTATYIGKGTILNVFVYVLSLIRFAM
jgi:hypothetical protein